MRIKAAGAAYGLRQAMGLSYRWDRSMTGLCAAKTSGQIAVLLALLGALAACRHAQNAPSPQPKAFGSALVEVSGGLQAGAAGSLLAQPLVVQVNDAQGAPVAGALVTFRSAGGAAAEPSSGLTGDDGQLSVKCRLGGAAGRYQIVAATAGKNGKPVKLSVDEIALGLQQNLGRELSERYCSRCHNQESTAERVSNFDNLTAKPHAFTDGAFLNAMSDADLTAITTYGGPARGKSAEMPPYGGTLSKTDIEALTAYMRTVATPPYRGKGLIYASQ